MAPFNPEVPKSTQTEIPAAHFPFLSREISPLTPNRSGEFLGKGVGQVLEEGSSLIDKTYDAIVTNETRNEVDPVEKDYQNQLEQTYQDLSGQGQSGRLAYAEDAVPPEIKGLPGTLDKMEASRANGKRSESEHYRDLVDLSTRLRARFPGKRDLVDAEISRISGVHPANKYIQSRLADINSFLTASNEKRNKIETMAAAGLKDGDIDYSTYIGWKRGDGSVKDEDIYKAIAAGGKRRLDHQTKMYSIEEEKGDAEGKQRKAIPAAVVDGYSRLDQAMDNFYVMSGLNDPMKMKDWLAKVAANPTQFSPEQLEEAKVNLAGFKQRFLSQLRADWAKPLPGKEASTTSLLGDKQEEVIKKVEDELDGWISLIGNPKDADAAGLAARQVKAAAASGERALETDPKVGPIARLQKAIKDTMGPEAYAQFYNNNQEAWDALKNMDQRSQFFQNTQKLVMQPGISMGSLETLKQQLENARTKGITGPDGAAFYDRMISFVTDMLGKDMPNDIKENIVHGVYGVDNMGVTQLFNKDTVNSKGIPVPGQMSVFIRLLNQGSVDHTFKLAKDTNNPNLFNNVQIWSEYEFGTLFRNNIQDLNQAGHDFSNIDIQYDAKRNKFYAQNPSGGRIPKALEDNLRVLNSGIESMNHLYSKVGESTGLFLYRLLDTYGLNSDLEQKMSDAIAHAYQSKAQQK